VLDAFVEKFGADDALIRRGPADKGHVDLRQAVRLQLVRAGLSPDRIDTTDRCTFRDADEFFSHRRDRGVTGRMAAIIAPRSRA
jgi:copper oxidase (laccase) domain-containing protein